MKRAVRNGPTYARELLPVKRAALARRGVAVDSRVLGERRQRATRYFRELAAPLGGRHSLMAYLTLRGPAGETYAASTLRNVVIIAR